MADIAFLTERLLRGFGVDLVVDVTARRLAAAGHEVTVYACDTDERAHGTDAYRLRTLPTTPSVVYPLYEAHARAWAPHLDGAGHGVILIESFPFYSLLPMLETPTIAVDHGICPAAGLPAHVQLDFAYMRFTQYRRHMPHADGLIAVSDFVRSSMPRRLGARCATVHNGADHLPLADPSAGLEMRRRLDIDLDEVVALYVGRLSPEGQPYKGTRDLMAMAGRLREEGVRLVMAGRGDARDAAAIQDARATPVVDLSTDELAALYAAADVYLTASRWEGFDLPLLEAARAGVPAVALNVGAHPEVTLSGRSALLCDDLEALLRSTVLLARDSGLRADLGRNALRHASDFTWDAAAQGYEDVVSDVLAKGYRTRRATPPTSDSGHDTTAVILNYGADVDTLRTLLRSLQDQTHPVEVLVVDNASPKNLDALDVVAREFPSTRLLRLSQNHGFAGGMNRGVEQTSTRYVLLLNNDTILDRTAVEEMVRVIEANPTCVGVAPKILFADAPHVIDSIGNLMNRAGAAYNMGIGQLDIGQYDRVESTFGPCFAATLIRRVAWTDGEVGPLDESYFMYYEDVDWNFRAGLLGWDFLTAPRAVVFHAHSLSTREHDYVFKYHLIQRNYIKTVAKNYPSTRMLLVVARRLAAMTVRSALGPYRRASARTVWETLRALPDLARKRVAVQGRRQRRADDLLSYAHGEHPHFDPVAYEPEVTLENLRDMYGRLYLLSGEDRHREIAEMASALAGSRLRGDSDVVRARLEPLIEAEPVSVKRFIQEL